MIKRVLYLLFTAFLIYRSWELFEIISIRDLNQFSSPEKIFLSLLFTIYITGIFAFTGFSFPTHRLFPESYYRVRNLAQLRSFFLAIGGKPFQKFIFFLYWGKPKNRHRFFSGKRSGLDGLVRASKQAEFSHLGAFMLLFVPGILVLAKGQVGFFLFILIPNLILNFYPILLQRVHRGRIGKMLNRSSL